MRRVYDDAHYEQVASAIDEVLHSIDPYDVSRYENGDVRAQQNLIVAAIFGRVSGVKLGRNCNTTGIGNNWAHELIFTGDEDEQICGVLHLTFDMYSSIICWVSDIDGGRETDSVTISGNACYRRIMQEHYAKYRR